MPFSMAAVQKHNRSILQFYKKIPYKKMKKIVTLQVRILAVYLHECVHCHGRKAFLSVPAGMTLEAALVLPLFIFASVSLILPMKIMNTERKIQAGLEAAGEELSQYAYLQDVILKGEEEQIPGADNYAKDFCKNLAGAAAGIYAQLRVQDHVDTRQVIFMNALQSSVLEDGEMLDLVLNYQIQMPFPVLGLEHISRTARSRRIAWIGREGHDGTAGGGENGTDEDEIVYVGRNSTRYHRSRSCHYLVNNLSPVAFSEIEGLRNKSGGKYYACKVCGDGAAAGSTVYIMPEGSSYHRTKNCSAIVSYVRAVKLREVAHLGPCSYCGK